MSRDYTCTIRVKASAGQAFEAISDIAKWWATNFEGKAKFPGDCFRVRFGKTYSVMEVTESDPGKKLVWTIKESHLPLFKDSAQWNGTRIAWAISTRTSETEITMTHVGLTPETECYYDCEKGWDFYVGESLYNLITVGEGFPGTGIFSNISHGDRKYEGLLYFKNDPLPQYQGDYFFIDVKETDGERVTSAYTAAEYCKETFDPVSIMGEYFMIVENRPLYGNILPINDILETIKTEKMETQNYHRQVTVHKKPGEAFDAICHVSDWWAKDLTGSSGKLNDIFTVRFGETFVTFRITELIPGRKIVWYVNDCNLHWLNDKKEWKDTTVIWTLSSENGSTHIDFTHVGLIPEVECYDQCVKGWDFYVMESLKKLIIQGKGLPETPASAR